MEAVVVADLAEITQPDCFALAASIRNAALLSQCKHLLSALRFSLLQILLRSELKGLSAVYARLTVERSCTRQPEELKYVDTKTRK